MSLEKKYFNGLMNGDDAAEFVAPNEYINAVNIRYGTSDGGKTGWLENVNSNELVTNSLPSGSNYCYNSIATPDNLGIIFFNGNSLGNDGIYYLLASTGVVYKVLMSSDVTGGLNFDQKIQSTIVGDNLFWTDGISDFRRINYKAAANYYNPGLFTGVYSYSSPLSQEQITVLRKPPRFPLTATKETNSLVANFIKDEAFKFAYFYTYKDGEESVLSSWSSLVDYNFDGDSFDTVSIKIPFSESIQSDVKKVNIVVKYESTNKAFVVKTFDRDVYSTEFTDHNSATTQLEFKFYNNQNGIALSDAYTAKQFDSVPILPRTVESAKNRIFAGNYTKGYDTPSSTSLSLSIPSASTVTGRWFKLMYRTGGGGTATKYVIDITGIGSSYDGYYEDPAVSGPAFPASVNFATLIFKGAGFISMLSSYGVSTVDLISFSYEGVDSTVTGAPVSSYAGVSLMKSDASYQAGVVFFNYGRQKCGVVTNDDLRITTPDRTYTDLSLITGINWTLSNTSALTEIPSWATHYAVVSTKCLRTSFFMQLRTDKAIYVDKDSSGNYVFGTTSAYSSSRAGIAISIKNLTSYKMGYTFNKGDICKLYITTNVYSLAIIAQEGDWIICQNKDVGALNIDTVKFEIYTPKKGSTQELFFQQGEIFQVNNPGTNTREYSSLAGTIPGDVWVVNRDFSGTTYTVEVMSPNDKFYQNWFTDAGSVDIIDPIGAQSKPYFFSWSNAFVTGSSSNGLCTFDALDETSVPYECGDIQKLQLTSKTKEDGSIMLAICDNETASVYLGESQLVTNTGSSFVAKADGVVGNINVLKGSFGTQHPESVAVWRGMVIWWDATNGQVIQYASNGLFPISEYKMSTVFGEIGKEYAGGDMYFIGGFDPLHNEYLLSTQFTGTNQGNFPQTTQPKRLKVFDSNPFTLAYKVGGDKWVTKYDFIAENFVYLGNRLYSFKNGELWRHGAEGYNNFYGTQYDSIISFVGNQEPSGVKTYLNVNIEANRPPDNTYVYSKYPKEQITTLVSGDFKQQEGVWYAPIYRDLLSQNTSNKLHNGERMRATSMYFQLHFSGSSKLELRFVNINYNKSLGHKTEQ